MSKHSAGSRVSIIPPANNQKYYAAIDGLRALAVIAVIINHFDDTALPSGYLGVDIFFVISGYVITASLAGRKNQSAEELLSGFYQRRIKRLFPALAACVLITSVALCFFNPEPLPQLKTAAFSLIGASNIQLHLNTIDYWGESAQLNPFAHTWSLGVEEQFYLVFPILICLTVLGNWSSAKRFRLKWALALLSAASLGWFLWESTVNASSAYYLMHFRFWELGIGCILYLFLSEKGDWKLKLVGWKTISIILAALVAALFIPTKYSAWATLLSVFLTAIVIALTQLKSSKFILLDNKLLVGIGLISYSLYLWHWPIIVISRFTIGISWWTIPIQLAAIVAVSLASYFYIEKPFRKSQWLQTRKQRYITASATSLCAALTIAMMLSAPSQSLYLGKKAEEKPIINATYEVNCGVNSPETSKTHQTVRTVGNSHSVHIVPMLKKIGRECGWIVLHEKHPDYIEFPDGNNTAINRLSEVLLPLQSRDLLILSARNRNLYQIPYLNGKGDKWEDSHLKRGDNTSRLNNWLKELDIIVRQAKSKNIEVILFLPNVEFDTQVMKKSMCQEEWFQLSPTGCNPRVSKEFLSRRFSDQFFQEVDLRATQHQNLHVFNPLPVYCKGRSSCPRKINGLFAFSDTNHLSPEGSLLMLEKFNDFLLANDLIWDISASEP